MAKTNKYTSINFNHVLEKNIPVTTSTTSAVANPKQPSRQSSYSSVASPSKNHGRMLVLTRPTPKPIATPTTTLQPQPRSYQPSDKPQSDRAPDAPPSDQISLRPLGRTGNGLSFPSTVPAQEKDKQIAPMAMSPKTDRFVPPHLRPGFVAKEESPGPGVYRGRDSGHRHHGSPNPLGEVQRPKSGDYERIGRGGERDMALNRPRSSGNRPSSSGWYVSCFPHLWLALFACPAVKIASISGVSSCCSYGFFSCDALALYLQLFVKHDLANYLMPGYQNGIGG